MLLQKIILENYGLFAGKIEFDLAPRIRYRKERPIILFGGKNGAGKTTILEAIRLVLYGKAILGNRVTKDEYETFLHGRIHTGNNELLEPTYARVSITFEHVEIGEKKQYVVERAWTKKNNTGVKEFLKIKVNGKAMEKVTPGFWRGFIEDIIPERLSQLFFFDGEKIRGLADDESNSHVLADSIKMLLGLDIVERLKTDLEIYSTREARKRSDAKSKRAWDTAEKQIRNLKKNIRRDLDELAHIRTILDGILADIRNREKRLHQEGHLFATKRDNLTNKKTEIAAKIKDFEEKIRFECEKTYPFSLCPTMGKLLMKQLRSEEETKRLSLLKDELTDFHDAVVITLAEDEIIPADLRKKITLIIQKAINKKTDISIHPDAVPVLHEFSTSDVRRISDLISDSEERAITVHKTSEALQIMQNKLRDIVKELTRGPDEAQVQATFTEISSLNQRLGEFQQKEKNQQKEIKTKEYNLKALQREQNRYLDQQVARKDFKDRQSKIDTIQATLDAYLEKITASKIKQLCQTVVQGFNSLSHKGNIIKDIKIDPDNFTTTLYDQAEKPKPQESLSSAEKQLLAIAMLWGLAKTSGRPLPVVIDTPLGRLDSDHRSNLINNYFPHASHQVILLSTDTEVDQQLYRELSPNISHCYHLVYDGESNSTKVREEYFWKGLQE